MDVNSLFERNLLAMSTTKPELSRRVGQVKSSDRLILQTARSGEVVPLVKKEDRYLPLHSLYNPRKEGERFLSVYPPKDCLVFLGLGAAYHIVPYLEHSRVAEIFIIDTDLSLFRSLMENIDFTDILTDRRVHLLIDENPKQIRHYLLGHYIPAASGSLSTLVLRQRVQTEHQYFSAAADAVKQAIEPLADDYTVQSTFGKKWFKNTLINLKKAGEATTVLKPARKVIVTGAGPSLEDQLEALPRLLEKGYLIATDTTLPVLLDAGFLPDAVLSIDCQHVSYHHFMKGMPRNIPLVLDLASPPLLSRISDHLLFFSSGHPLSLYAGRRFRSFPQIDITGGNVSHAAISLATKLGAKEIHLLGADFSYPEGKPYARGTYIYPYFYSLQNRLESTENLFFQFVMRNKSIIREKTDFGLRYTTRPMVSYRDRLEKAARKIDARIIPAIGKGVPIRIPERKTMPSTPFKTLFSAGPREKTAEAFLVEYLDSLKKLPPVSEAAGSYLSSLTNEEKELWYTMFPTAAAFRRIEDDMDSRTLLRRVKDWTLSIVEDVMNGNND